MARKAIISTKPFQGIRIEVDTTVSFDDVLSQLRRLMGDASVPQVVTLAKEATTEAEFIQRVQERLVGESGFMLFHEIDHGGWLPRVGINPRVVRWILGNPLTAITMIRHDITAGLFAPLGILGSRKERRPRTAKTHPRPPVLIF